MRRFFVSPRRAAASIFMQTRPSFAAPLALLLCIAPVAAAAQTESPQASATERPTGDDFWRVVGSPYTVHFHPDPDHEPVYAIGLERQRSDKWLWGGTYFSNSFGQPSGYVYLGQRYGQLFSVDKLFFQWTAGLMYGYKEPFEDKVPLNHNGFSPGAVLSLGWQFSREFSVQANLLGTAAVMLQFSYDIR
jgi:hypothetical protein